MEDAGGGGDFGGDFSGDVGADAASSLDVPMGDDVLETAEATGELAAAPEAPDLLGNDSDIGASEAPLDLDAVAATGGSSVGDLPDELQPPVYHPSRDLPGDSHMPEYHPADDLSEELEPPVYHPSRDLPADLVPDRPADPSQPDYRPYDQVPHTDRTIEQGGGAARPEGEPGRGGLNVPPEGWRPGGPERG